MMSFNGIPPRIWRVADSIILWLNHVSGVTGIIPRLVNGDCDADEDAWYGLLEVSLDGGETWGSVCDDYFDDNAAK